MSRIYFHSPSGEAELWGGERAWLGGLCGSIAIGLANVQYHIDTWKKLVAPSHYLKKEGWQYGRLQWADAFEVMLRAGWGDCFLEWHGKQIDGFSLILNTVAAVGSDTVKLAARLHSQCEIHCFVEGVDRAWLAQLIYDGLESGVFRKNTGTPTSSWESVRKFLLSRDDEPVVTSYSVTDQFPNQEAAGWETHDSDDDERDDAWYGLPHEERWNLAMEGIRKSDKRLRLDPGEWNNFNFNHGLTMMDITASDHEARLTKALKEDATA